MKKQVTRFRLFQFLTLIGILMCSAPAFAAYANYTSMVNGGQRYLKSTQQAATYNNITGHYTGGGSWNDDGYSSGYLVPTTAFAVAALIDTGIPKTDKHVIDGINYILSQVQTNGTITSTNYNTNYNTGSALIALSEYGDPPNNTTLSTLTPAGGVASYITIAQYRAIVKKAADYVIAHQGTRPSTTSGEGSWSYELDSSIYGGDMSNTQFGIMGPWYAYNYLGLPLPTVEMVFATPAGGTFKAAQTVYLTDLLPLIYAAQTPALTASVNIYYTTDGTVPTNLSTKYNDANGITISANTTLKFFYVDNTVAASPVTSTIKTLTYVINAAAAADAPAEIPWTSKLYGYILRCQATAGGTGNISYLADSNYYASTSMTGAGLFGLAMIGEGQSAAANKAIAWFNTNYTWAENTVGRGFDAYYYAMFGMAKALTGTIGPDKRVGDSVTGHLWSQDLVTQMHTFANFVPPNVYWEKGGWLDGGKNMATAWVLMGMAFIKTDQPSPQKIIAPGDVISPIIGNVTIKTDNGLIDAGKDNIGNSLPFKNSIADNIKDATAILPIGGLRFNIINVGVGGTANLTVLLPPQACDPAVIASFLKNVGVQKGNTFWYKLVNAFWKPGQNIPIVFDPVQCSMVVTLKDGGIGDDDGVADGVITDPGAPGLDMGTVSNALRALRIAVGAGAAATAAETADLDVALDANGNKNGVGIADALMLLRRAVGAI